jgi:hypothetical protein
MPVHIVTRSAMALIDCQQWVLLGYLEKGLLSTPALVSPPPFAAPPAGGVTVPPPVAAVGTACAAQVMVGVVPPDDVVQATTRFLVVSINHVELLAAPLVPEVVPNKGI